MKITIIGKGRLGRSLSILLHNNNIKHQLLGKQEHYNVSGLVYICVPESSIEAVAQKLAAADILLHSSGTLSSDVLNHPCSGCLHPIMTFPGPEVNLPSQPIPATYQGSDIAFPFVKDLAAKLGFTLYPYMGCREKYHSAAVISGNFATILLHGAASILEAEGVDKETALEMLLPLALNSLKNANKGSLSSVLTGPISRNEYEICQKHIDRLSLDHDEISTLYKGIIKLHTVLA